MKFNPKCLRLYAISDDRFAIDTTLLAQVEEAIAGGITCLQYRKKEGMSGKEAKQLQDACKKANIPFIINDNVDLGIALHADGIHIGQEDGDVVEIKKKLHEDQFLGVSATSLEEAILAQKQGADYIGVGAMFLTPSKHVTHTVSFETLQQIREAVDIPIVVIGGIEEHNLHEFKGTGIQGFSMIHAIFGANDIANNCRHLLHVIDEVLSV